MRPRRAPAGPRNATASLSGPHGVCPTHGLLRRAADSHRDSRATSSTRAKWIPPSRNWLVSPGLVCYQRNDRRDAGGSCAVDWEGRPRSAAGGRCLAGWLQTETSVGHFRLEGSMKGRGRACRRRKMNGRCGPRPGIHDRSVGWSLGGSRLVDSFSCPGRLFGMPYGHYGWLCLCS